MKKSIKKESDLINNVNHFDKVKDIENAIANTKDNTPDLWMQHADALVEQQLIGESIKSLSRAISIDPFCGILYRWRGHRHLNCGEIAEACADFAIASRLIPDNWAVWYHLALTHVLLGDYGLAEYEYKKCWEIPCTKARMVALTNWHYITLRYQKKNDEAKKLLVNINRNIDAGGNIGYLHLCLLFKGELLPEDLKYKINELKNKDRAIRAITKGFGLVNYYNIMGDIKNSNLTIDYILKIGENNKDSTTCFGYQGASYMKKNIK